MTTPTVPHFSKLYAVQDCKIALLLDDPATGDPDYDDLIDVPGIKSFVISGDMDTKTLRGDNKLLDSVSSLTNIQIKVENAKLSLDVLAALLGGEVADATTGTGSASWDLMGSSVPQYIKIEAATPPNGSDTIGGDVHFTIWKCSLSAYPDMGLAEEDYQIVSFQLDAVPLICNDKWLTPTYNKVATPIA